MGKKIGFIGLGAMGRPMATNFVKAGYAVYVYDISEAARKNLAELSAIPCSTIGELAKESDVIFCSLPNGAIVQSTMTGEAGVFAFCKENTVIVDLSSVAPETSIQMNKLAAAKNCYYLDAPVSGGVSGAEAGTLTLMVGGEKEIFDQIHEQLECIGKNIFYIGKSGSGDAMKIVNNLMLGCNMAALAEALVLGEKCGLDLEIMQQIISISSGRSYASDAKLEKFIMQEKYDGGFAVMLQHKDLGLALEAAKSVGMPTPMASTATQIYELAKNGDYAKKDISSVVAMWSELTHTEMK